MLPWGVILWILFELRVCGQLRCEALKSSCISLLKSPCLPSKLEPWALRPPLGTWSSAFKWSAPQQSQKWKIMTLNHECRGDVLVFFSSILEFSKFPVISMATFVIRKRKLFIKSGEASFWDAPQSTRLDFQGKSYQWDGRLLWSNLLDQRSHRIFE